MLTVIFLENYAGPLCFLWRLTCNGTVSKVFDGRGEVSWKKMKFSEVRNTEFGALVDVSFEWHIGNLVLIHSCNMHIEL
jgi:hypothetical protein